MSNCEGVTTSTHREAHEARHTKPDSVNLGGKACARYSEACLCCEGVGGGAWGDSETIAHKAELPMRRHMSSLMRGFAHNECESAPAMPLTLQSESLVPWEPGTLRTSEQKAMWTEQSSAFRLQADRWSMADGAAFCTEELSWAGGDGCTAGCRARRPRSRRLLLRLAPRQRECRPFMKAGSVSGRNSGTGDRWVSAGVPHRPPPFPTVAPLTAAKVRALVVAVPAAKAPRGGRVEFASCRELARHASGRHGGLLRPGRGGGPVAGLLAPAHLVVRLSHEPMDPRPIVLPVGSRLWAALRARTLRLPCEAA